MDLISSSSSDSSTDSSSDSSSDSHSKSKSSSQSSVLTISSPPGSSPYLSGNSNKVFSTSKRIKRSIHGSPGNSNEVPVDEVADSEDVRMLDDLLGIKQRITCEFCGKKVQKNYLSRHMKNIHSEGKPGCVVECGQCDKRILLSDMRNHVLNNHLRLEESPPSLSDASLPSSQQPTLVELCNKKPDHDTPPEQSDGQNVIVNFGPCSHKKATTDKEKRIVQENNPGQSNGKISKNMSEVQDEHSVNVLCFDTDDDSDMDMDEDMDIVPNHTFRDVTPGEKDPLEDSIFHKHDNNNFQDKEENLGIKSFLNVSDDTDDSDIVIEEIIPSVAVAEVKPDINQNRILKPLAQPAKVQFLVKCHERNPAGGKVKSMRLVMRDTMTVGQAKRKYSNKQLLDRNKVGELQFVLEGAILVEKLNQKIVMAVPVQFVKFVNI